MNPATRMVALGVAAPAISPLPPTYWRSIQVSRGGRRRQVAAAGSSRWSAAGGGRCSGRRRHAAVVLKTVPMEPQKVENSALVGTR